VQHSDFLEVRIVPNNLHVIVPLYQEAEALTNNGLAVDQDHAYPARRESSA
jgi:hypothetical protein